MSLLNACDFSRASQSVDRASGAIERLSQSLPEAAAAIDPLSLQAVLKKNESLEAKADELERKLQAVLNGKITEAATVVIQCQANKSGPVPGLVWVEVARNDPEIPASARNWQRLVESNCGAPIRLRLDAAQLHPGSHLVRAGVSLPRDVWFDVNMQIAKDTEVYAYYEADTNRCDRCRPDSARPEMKVIVFPDAQVNLRSR